MLNSCLNCKSSLRVYDKYNRPCLVFAVDVHYIPLSDYVSQDLVAAIVELNVDGY